MAGDRRIRTRASQGARHSHKIERMPIRIPGVFKTTWRMRSNVHTIAGLNVKPLRPEDLANARPIILAVKSEQGGSPSAVEPDARRCLRLFIVVRYAPLR